MVQSLMIDFDSRLAEEVSYEEHTQHGFHHIGYGNNSMERMRRGPEFESGGFGGHRFAAHFFGPKRLKISCAGFFVGAES